MTGILIYIILSYLVVFIVLAYNPFWQELPNHYKGFCFMLSPIFLFVMTLIVTGDVIGHILFSKKEKDDRDS